MIKSAAALLALLAILLFSILSDIVGVYFMIDSAIYKNENFMMGFTMFSFGTIIFICIAIAHHLTKIHAGTTLIANSLADLMEHTIKKESAQTENRYDKSSIMDLLKGKFGPGMNFGNTTVHISSIDENGNTSPLMTKSFENLDDFFKHRDSIIAQAFGSQPGEIQKQINEMTIEELQEKEQEAVAEQKFELAAAFRDAIQRKQKPEN